MGVRKYDEDFKRVVVAASYSNDESVISVSRRYNVATSAIYGWRKIYGDPGASTASLEDPASFVPICVDATADPEPISPPTVHKNCHITVKYGVNREIVVSGTFEIGDLVRFVRGVAL